MIYLRICTLYSSTKRENLNHIPQNTYEHSRIRVHFNQKTHTRTPTLEQKHRYDDEDLDTKRNENNVASKVEVGGSINNDPTKKKDKDEDDVKKLRYRSCCERYAPHRWRGAPFRELGRNSILFYMACLMCASWIPFLKPQFFGLGDFNTWQKLASSLLSMSIWFVVAWHLDSKRWYWVVGREEFCNR